MIKIQRIYPGPAKLLKNGNRQTELDCAAYDEKPEEYRDGTKRFTYKNYYNWGVVKDALMKMHHGKCCYCEKDIERADLHVEHFRPKGAFRQASNGDYEYPGYYWLAYSWDNLLLACPTCNGAKSATFPLANPEERARSHNDDLGKEIAIYVNPTIDNPRDHIRFKDDAPYPLTERGLRTINDLKLRRDGLNELRLKHFSIFNDFRFILEYSLEHDHTCFQQKAARKLRESLQEEAQFSSMVKDLFEPTDPLLAYIEQSGD